MARGDLSDKEWEQLAPLLPPQKSGRPGRPYKKHRTVLDGILWVGAPWRDLPERYGPWNTCYERLMRWKRDGTWERIFQQVQGRADASGEVLWEACSVDSTSIKAPPHAAGARKAPAKKGAVAARRAPRKAWDAVGVV